MSINSQILAFILGAIPGVLALIGASIGYGRLQQRLVTVEKDVSKFGELSEKVARIDERTSNTDRQLSEIKGDVSRLVQNLIDEPARLWRGDRHGAHTGG